jgi:hypothetical protein
MTLEQRDLENRNLAGNYGFCISRGDMQILSFVLLFKFIAY